MDETDETDPMTSLVDALGYSPIDKISNLYCVSSTCPDESSGYKAEWYEHIGTFASNENAQEAARRHYEDHANVLSSSVQKEPFRCRVGLRRPYTKLHTYYADDDLYIVESGWTYGSCE